MSDETAGGGRSYQVSADLKPPRFVSAVCLASAAGFFVTAWVLAYRAAPDVVAYFYQPRVVAIVHSLTLGWISLTIMGVLYQFVPSLTKQPVSWPGAAIWQVLLFIAGAVGMVASFWFGRLEHTAWSATAVAASILWFVAQIVPSLFYARRADATTIGMLCALAFYATTALLGLTYAWDKLYGFLSGSVLSNISAHAHFGLIGWVTLTICAVSYRVVTAFLLPTTALPKSALPQVVTLAVIVPVLGAALLLRSPWAAIPAMAAFACLLWYAMILREIARTRRMPIDWAMRHVAAALGQLLVGSLCGMMLFVIDPQSAAGSRLAATYGLFVLVGWISNYIVGIGARMAPALVGLGPQPLLVGSSASLVFVVLNAAVATMAIGLVAGSERIFRASVLALLFVGVVLIVNLARRLSLRRLAPRPGRRT